MTTPTFKPSSPDDFIQLSPLGLFQHARGLQRVDHTALENLVRNFKSFFARLGRRFAGLPFYVGHPDVPGYENTYTDRKAYGWIMDLEAREDGLYGRPKWSLAGRELIGNGHYKFLSPTWTVEKVGTDNGRPVYRPTQLISVGLTNEPNLPVLPLANCDTPNDPGALVGLAIELVNHRSEQQNPASTIPATEIVDPEESVPAHPENTHTLQPEINPHFSSAPHQNTPSHAKLEERIAQLEECLANCERQLAVVQDRLITTILDNAITDGRIPPSDRRRWRTDLQDDFDAAHGLLTNSQPHNHLSRHLGSPPKSDGLTPLSSSATSFAGREKQIHLLVNERMRTAGLSYHAAWIQVRADHPEIF